MRSTDRFFLPASSICGVAFFTRLVWAWQEGIIECLLAKRYDRAARICVPDLAVSQQKEFSLSKAPKDCP